MRCVCGNLVEREVNGEPICVPCLLQREQDDSWEVVDGDVCPDCGNELDVDWETEQVSCIRCGWGDNNG